MVNNDLKKKRNELCLYQYSFDRSKRNDNVVIVSMIFVVTLCRIIYFYILSNDSCYI